MPLELPPPIAAYVKANAQLDVDGMLFANRCTWAHALVEVAQVLSLPRESLLDGDELAAVEGDGDPKVLWRDSAT